jgi:hypothetical protein
MRRSCAAILAALIALAPPRSPRTLAVDFLRGDANSDGVLSLADAYFIYSHVFRDHAAPECREAGNANGDRKIDVADAIWIVNYLFRNGPASPEPFPLAGPGTELDALPCAAYGNGSPLADPAARLVVEAPVVDKGGVARFRIGVANSRTLTGLSGRLRLRSGLLAPGVTYAADLSGALQPDGFIDANHLIDGDDEVLQFGLLTTIQPPFLPSAAITIAASAPAPVLEIGACLRAGVPAGEHQLILETGELIDEATGRAIQPVLEAGTLTIPEGVSSGAACRSSTPPPPATLPPPPNVRLEMRDTTAEPGASFAVPFLLRSDRPVQGLLFSIDFDEETLEATAVEEVWARPDGAAYDYAVYTLQNENRHPGNAGVDEGFIVGMAIPNDSGPAADRLALPANVDVEVLRFHFTAAAEAVAARTDVRFLDGALGAAFHGKNLVIVDGVAFTAELASSFVLIGCEVCFGILPDGTIFRRGDATDDDAVDISDPVRSLGYLFLGDEAPRCIDAADANDDGALNIADPIATLTWLFLGGTPLPAPGPEAGHDPTPDALPECTAADDPGILAVRECH